MSTYHTPVLLKESIDGLVVNPEGTYVDVTYGGGGHSNEILKRLKTGRLIAFDQDADSETNVHADKRLIFVRQNFIYLKNNLKYLGFGKVDGLIADLGVSSHQFDQSTRGFSYRQEGPLDMRMNMNADFSAADLINQYSVEDLRRVFWELGEVKNARKLAACINRGKADVDIDTIEVFLEVIKPCVPSINEYKYLARVFQALRIEVNQEMDALRKLLKQSVEVLGESGRLVVISYHSLEDRLVKNYIKYGDFKPVLETDIYGNRLVPLEAMNRKVIVPSQEEIDRNPRARSAKLRIAIRKPIHD